MKNTLANTVSAANPTRPSTPAPADDRLIASVVRLTVGMNIADESLLRSGSGLLGLVAIARAFLLVRRVLVRRVRRGRREVGVGLPGLLRLRGARLRELLLLRADALDVDRVVLDGSI